MSQLNKKCFMASAAFHGLLFLVLLVGPAFFVKERVENPLPTLEVLPSQAIDQLFYRPEPPAPEPRKPEPRKPEPIKQAPKPKPPEPTPPKPPTKSEPRYNSPDRIKVNRNKQFNKSRPQVDHRRALEAERAAERIRSAVAETTISVPKGSVSFANHAQLVMSKYKLEWSPPSGIDKSSAIAEVRVVIRRDGAVLSSSLIKSSGDPTVDASIRSTLKRVTRVPKFPAGATEETRTYVIGFQLEAR